MIRQTPISAMFILCCAAICFAADLNGRWEGTVKGPDGDEIQLTFVFKVDGEKLTGTVDTPIGELTISEGKVKGEEFSFTVVLTDGEVTHQGKLSGDTIKMKSQAPWGEQEFTLKRVAAKAKQEKGGSL